MGNTFAAIPVTSAHGLFYLSRFFSGKELTRDAGIDLCDFEARQFDNLRFLSPDPLCEDYYSISPYAYCLNNPLRNIDPDGKKVYLYATHLPGVSLNYDDFPSRTKGILPTHTFIVVSNDNVGTQIFSFGSEFDGAKGAVWGKLKRRHYNQDYNIVQGKERDKLKSIVEITPPEGMSEEEFDTKVLETASSFESEANQYYFLLPFLPRQGNCNSSTSAILMSAGISKDELKVIKDKIPGISYGFSPNGRAWTMGEKLIKPKFSILEILFLIK